MIAAVFYVVAMTAFYAGRLIIDAVFCVIAVGAAFYAGRFVEKELKLWCDAAKVALDLAKAEPEKSGFYREYQRRTGRSFIAAGATFFVVACLTV
jgi:hypothetical protein